MRVASGSLLLICLVFLLNVGASFVVPQYREILRETKGQIFGMKPQSGAVEAPSDTKLLESIERMNTAPSTLSGGVESMGTGSLESTSGSTLSGVTATGGQVSESGSVQAPEEESSIPVSGLFLAKILRDVNLKKVENSGIFDIHIFTSMRYSTYLDSKVGMKVFAFEDSYDTVFKNFKLVSSVYSTNETDTFFGFTFFLNPTKKDQKVRFVTALEGRAIGVEIPKTYYSKLKTMLTK